MDHLVSYTASQETLIHPPDSHPGQGHGCSHTFHLTVSAFIVSTLT